MKDFAKSIRTVNSIPGSWTKINLMDGPAQEKKYKKYSMIVQHDSDSELGEWWSWYVYNGNTEIASGESKSESEAKTKAEKYIEYNVPMPTGNSKVWNYSITAETAASTMTKEEFDGVIKAFKEELERAKRDGRKDSAKAYEDALKRAMDLKKKYIGNSKVGNFMHDAKGQVEDMITLSERLVSQGNKERAKDVLGTMEIIFRQLNADKDEYYQKYKETDELISKLKRAAIKLKSIV